MSKDVRFELPKVSEIKGAIASRDVIRQNATTGRTTYKVPFENVVIRKGFNVRSESYGNIEELAKSILENGLKTPMEGDMTEDGKVYLVDGERRYLAFKWMRENESKLREEGYTQPVDIELEFFINGKKTTEEERIISVFTSNDNEKLTAVEVATILKRLANMGYNDEEIARKIGKSVWYVQDHLIISNSDTEIQEAISSGNISATSVVKAKKKGLSQDEIKETIKKAKTSGKSVKNKDIDKAVARKKARDLFANPVQFDEIEKVIDAWAGWAFDGKKGDLTELKKEIKSLYKQ